MLRLSWVGLNLLGVVTQVQLVEASSFAAELLVMTGKRVENFLHGPGDNTCHFCSHIKTSHMTPPGPRTLGNAAGYLISIALFATNL